MPPVINWRGKAWVVLSETTRRGAGYCPHVHVDLLHVHTGTRAAFQLGNYAWTHEHRAGSAIAVEAVLTPNWATQTLSITAPGAMAALASPALALQTAWARCAGEECTQAASVRVWGETVLVHVEPVTDQYACECGECLERDCTASTSTETAVVLPGFVFCGEFVPWTSQAPLPASRVWDFINGRGK
jgi:hypothetical protein